MKSVDWTVLGSVGSLKPTEKSTGGEFITLPQVGLVMITKQTDGVGVGLGGTVEVGVAVAVAVPVGVTIGVAVGVAVEVAVAVGVGVGVPPPEMRNAYTLLSFAT